MDNEIMDENFRGGHNHPTPMPAPTNDTTWFWKDGLSIDETKMSTLIICLLVCMAFAGINYIANGDITNNLTAIIQALIYAIAGVNISNNLNGIFNKPSTNSSNYPNSSMPSSNMNNAGNTGNNTTMIPPGVTSIPASNMQNSHGLQQK